ncbi:MAG TPA: tetraacyldisaccharide 4'-kinase [Parasulfuritortus sp.]
MSLESSLVRCWYARCGWCLTLIPLSLLFAALAWLRRRFYRWGWLKSLCLPVPVVVIGNLTVGGTGKTPLAIWLVEMLRNKGYRPGVISRGYGASASAAGRVDTDSDPASAGDEPVLIARRARCPVWVGPSRGEAAQRLLAHHPEVDVLIADDGLQHYALARNVEIAVVDGQRRFGNGWRLPAGPLREGVGRLAEVDAVVVNGAAQLPCVVPGAYVMTLVGQGFHRLHDPGQRVSADFFRGRPVHAVAGIGNPERFFGALADLGLTVERHPFPDHHVYRPEDLPQGTIVMTEKDAVKCAAYAHPDAWVFAVDAEVSDGLEHLILNKLESRHGQQAA